MQPPKKFTGRLSSLNGVPDKGMLDKEVPDKGTPDKGIA
jgi:hypothetical protein